MRNRPRRVLLSVVALVLAAVPSGGAETVTVQVTGPLAFRAAPGALLDLAGYGSYRGTVEIRSTGAGLTVVNDLDLEDYLLGIREVPRMWPMEALKAQVVAARTYALWERNNGRFAAEGYDICPTVSCQVYAAADDEESEPNRRWAEAVRATAGEVLLYGDRPALARYHASSGGFTLPNHVVYGGNPRPYLMGTHDPDDAASPLHTWMVDFPHEVMDAILRPHFGYEGALTGVSSNQDARAAAVHTEDGTFELDILALRTIVVERAPALFPDRYPGPRPDGERMPTTLPSPRFDVEPYEGGFRLHGRGYGHGVGMSQWGARGRADRGESHAQILAAYYGGLQPQPWTGDATIRVGILAGVPELRVTAAAPFAVHDGAEPLEPEADGEWVVRPGPGGTLTVQRPPRPVVAAAEEPVELLLSDVSAPDRLEVDPEEDGAALPVRFSVTKPARVEAELLRSGEPVGHAVVEVEAGSSGLELELAAASLAEGVYRLRIRAVHGSEEALVERDVSVVNPPAPARDILPIALASLAAALATTLSRSGRDLDRVLRRSRR